MITKFNLIYSLKAAFRILTQLFKKFGNLLYVEKLSEYQGKYHAVYRIQFSEERVIRRWSVYISKKSFTQHFVERRQLEAKKLIVRKWEKEGCFSVFNPEKNTLYHVWPEGNRIYCECEDYANQIKFLGRGCCKHGYAVLSYLGFKNLKDYLDSGGRLL